MGKKEHLGSDGATTVLMAVLNGEQDRIHAVGRQFSQAERERSTERIARLVSALSCLQEACSSSDERQVERLRSEVNSLLLPYASVPTILIPSAASNRGRSKRGEGLSIAHHLMGLDQPVRLPGETESVRIPRSEAAAIAALQELVAQGRLAHLRRCLAPTAAGFRERIDPSVRCERWFLAPRVDRHWCSKTCYNRLYGTEPNYRNALLQPREPRESKEQRVRVDRSA